MMIQKSCMTALLLVLVCASVVSAAETKEAHEQGKKLTDASAVYHELVTASDRAIPKELLEDCKCVVVLPGVIKAAAGYGARHGSGVMTCRTAHGWSAPAFVNISGVASGCNWAPSPPTSCSSA